MNDLAIPIQQAETFFLQVLRLKDAQPSATAFSKYSLKKFDPMNPRESEPEQGYFEADVYDVLLATYKLPEFRCQNYNKQLLSIQPILYQLEGEIFILALHTKFLSAENPAMGDWLRFVEAFRWVQLRKFQEGTWKEKIVKSVEPLPEWLKDEKEELTARRIISVAFQKMFEREIDLQNDALFKNYGKLFVSQFLDLENDILEEDFYHILFVDRPVGLSGYGDPLPSEIVFKDELENNTYKRWIHQHQYFGFTGYSFCFVITPDEGRSKGIGNEQFLQYFQTRYQILYVIALLELSIQTRFIYELNNALKSDQNSGKEKKSRLFMMEKISTLREELLIINSKTWFGRIAQETQPRELFNLARKVLQTDKLHEEILSKISQLDEYQEGKIQLEIAQSQLSISKRLDLLQKIIVPFLVAGVIIALLQNNALYNCLKNGFSYLRIYEDVGYVFVVAILTTLISFIINKFVWRKRL